MEVKCERCGAIRVLKVPDSSKLCRSCARRQLIQEHRVNYPTKLCKFCHQPFVPQSNRQQYCKRIHERVCPICGKTYVEDNVENLKLPPVACSYECRVVATQSTSTIKYGCKAPGNNPEARTKSIQTMQARYGVDYAMQSSDIRKRARAKLLELYGVDNVAKDPNILARRMDTQRSVWISNGCISKTNRRFKDKLDAVGVQSEFELRIGTRYYDLHIPDQNLVIEIDPTYTHTSYGNHYGPGLDKYYHRDKTQLAEDNGYRCIHVFDWDNIDKVVAALGPKTAINASELDVYRLDPTICATFLNENHIQGSRRNQILCLGLVKDDEIYQVMTFGKPTFDREHDVQLYRICSKLGYDIIDGPDKLSKAASDFGVYNIITYCDRSKFTGDVYEKMGMKLIRTTPPQEIWSKEDKYITANLLRARGYDQLFKTNFGKSRSNEELMLENGWLPVYDCGQLVYGYR